MIWGPSFKNLNIYTYTQPPIGVISIITILVMNIHGPTTMPIVHDLLDYTFQSKIRVVKLSRTCPYTHGYYTISQYQ